MMDDPKEGFFYRIFYHILIYPLVHPLFRIINKLWERLTARKRQIKKLFEENEKLRQDIKNLSDKVDKARFGSNPILKKWMQEQLNLLYEEVHSMLNEVKSSELMDVKRNDKK